MDRVLALQTGFFRSNRPGYSHPVGSKLEKIVVSEWRLVIAVSLDVDGGVRLIKTVKTVHVHAKHYKHNEEGRTAPGVCGNGSILLSHLGTLLRELEYTHTDTGD